MRRLRVKLILPALTEATGPYWRPIKYSLFPPLGLATLAAFLAPDDEAVLVDERPDARPRRPSDLVLIQAYITNAYRAYRTPTIAGAFVAIGGCHLAARRAAASAAVFLPAEQRFRSFSRSSAPAVRSRLPLVLGGR
jgi:hypothetical protein